MYCTITGPLSVVWCFLWLFTTADTPKKHPRISRVEREYIEFGLADKGLKEEVCILVIPTSINPEISRCPTLRFFRSHKITTTAAIQLKPICVQ